MTTMAATAIDTLRYARRLKDAGLPPEQAEAMADAIGSELAVQIATKADLEVATAKLDAKITKMDSSLALLRWMVGFTLAFVVALTWRAFL